MHCLQASYYTSPESCGHCLSFCDDNDIDKDTHKDEDNDNDEDKDKDESAENLNICYIFEKLRKQGYQI